MIPRKSFQKALIDTGLDLKRHPLSTLQVNLGKRCNQACSHCHVEAGPNRTEIMEIATIDRILSLVQKTRSIHTVDLTGGAPELNPHFQYFVKTLRELGKTIIDRCNLTVFFEKGQENTPLFLRENGVEIVASLPCYSKGNVDKQRGSGVFDKSIKALQLLNGLGYGKPETGLVLNLVYNPAGPSLPPSQVELEKSYRQELREHFNIEFNHLFTITNMPIKRFRFGLERTGKLDHYLDLLVNNFNESAAKNVMCLSLLSVSWDGQLYDCDFNQMSEICMQGTKRSVWQIESFSEIEHEPITWGDHCFGCTAGPGSSCMGTLT